VSSQFFRLLKHNKLKFFVIGFLLLTSFSCAENRTVAIDKNNQEVSQNSKVSFASPTRAATTKFERNLPADFPFPNADDIVANRILKDYGAIFVARGGVVTPPKILFDGEEDCAEWQASVPKRAENFGVNIELQEPAMRELVAARDEARQKGFSFTARGTWAARRDYHDTVKIWLTRVNPGLAFWTQKGKLSSAEASRIRNLPSAAQIAEILRLEEKNLFFSKDFSKSILYSATSQHLSMLAVDINENGSSAVREVLARHGWFQTVVSDSPHFTFLGVAESELPALGLKKVVKDNRAFWIPD
jgi:hypothetical protein